MEIRVRTRVLGAVHLGVKVNHFIGQQLAASIDGALGVLGVIIIVVTGALREPVLGGVDEMGGRRVVVGVQRLHVLDVTLLVFRLPSPSKKARRGGGMWNVERDPCGLWRDE